jgi:hypothetical protein
MKSKASLVAEIGRLKAAIAAEKDVQKKIGLRLSLAAAQTELSQSAR